MALESADTVKIMEMGTNALFALVVQGDVLIVTNAKMVSRTVIVTMGRVMAW